MKATLPNISSVSSAIAAYDKPAVIPVLKTTLPNEYDGFRIEIANTITKLMDAAHLAYEGYLKKGFVTKSEHPFVFNDWDFSGISICLVAYDNKNNCVGTMTVVPDFEKLPLDITFGDEINVLRQKNHAMCEASRFAIDDEFKNQKDILVALMEWSYLITNHYFHGTDIIIEVNPRHQNFYLKKFLFQTETGVKECPLVNNAPAVLLRLPIKTCEMHLTNNTAKRLIYNQFKTADKKKLEPINQYIKKECKKVKPQVSLANLFVKVS